MGEQRVLPADVFDTLQFSALAFGGIGAGVVYRREDVALPLALKAPYCIIGHAIVAADQDTNDNPIVNALESIGIGVLENDNAVRRINERRSKDPESRVPFTPWRKELNIVRGGN